METNASYVRLERRRKPRISKAFHARVRGVNAGGETFEVRTVLDNMSSGGLYLRLNENVRRGTKLSVVIRLSTRHLDLVPVANVAVEGVVVRTEMESSGTYGVGIAISNRRFIS